MSGRGSLLHRSCFTAAAFALALMTLAGCSRGGEVRETVESRPGRIETTAAAEVIASEGGRILRDIAEARADVHRDYLLRAEGDIDRADRMLDVIDQSLPTAEARERIWVARRHLDYAEIREVAGDLVPIYAAVERVDSLTPADSIRGHVDRAERHLEKEDRKAAGRELARANQELLFVEVDLPLSSARRHLAEAREALAMVERDRAAAYLRQAEDDLVFLTGVARSPLGAARWSLAKAVAGYTKGDIEGAERYLTLTRRSVERARDNASEASRSSLKEVAGELRDLEGRLSTQRADALDELQRLGDQVRGLSHSG